MMRRWLGGAFLLVASMILTGCGGEADGLVPATGTITIDNQPGANAAVAFVPQTGTPGNGGTAIADAAGHYEIVSPQGKKGIAAGNYKVTVSRRLNADGSPPDPNVPEIESSAKETLPIKYRDRDKTELTATVAAGKSHDFSLNTGKKK